MPDFAAVIAARPLVLDAAHGTRLLARGLDPATDDAALWNLDRPADVRDLHARDVAAGADALLTNTFGAHRTRLRALGRAHQLEAVNRAAVSLARAAAGRDRFVLGDLGPIVGADLVEQAAILVDAGIDALLIETHTAETALTALDGLAPLGAAIVVSLHAWPSDPSALAARLADRGAVALGVNCVPLGTVEPLLARLAEAVDLPLFAKPSAGLPGAEADPPEAFAAAARRWPALGARLVGGCCGTDARHVDALRDAVDATLDAPLLHSTR